MNVKKYTALILITITLSSCSQRDEGTLLGNILGAGIGALVGFQFGSGVGGALSIAGGTIIGGLIGGEIANQLTENEQKEYGKATQELLTNENNIKTINWTSQDDGTKTGKITELNTFIKDKRNCKDIEQSIRIQGIEKFKVTTFCEDKGLWKAS